MYTKKNTNLILKMIKKAKIFRVRVSLNFVLYGWQFTYKTMVKMFICTVLFYIGGGILEAPF